MAAPLDGIIVLAVEQAIAAPFCTRQLVDLGARVLKIERPGSGDFARDYDRAVEGSSAFFVWGNRGKAIYIDVTETQLAQLGLTADSFVDTLGDQLGEQGMGGCIGIVVHDRPRRCGPVIRSAPVLRAWPRT